MATETGKDILVAWLNDAYAMEKGIVETLEAEVKVMKDHPAIRQGIEDHLKVTKNHVRLVESCLETLDEKPSGLKGGVASAMAKAQGLVMGAAKDSVVRSVLNDYTTELTEIASYRALQIAAEELGETNIAQTCDQIRQEEERMAAWLQPQLPGLVREAVATGGT